MSRGAFTQDTPYDERMEFIDVQRQSRLEDRQLDAAEYWQTVGQQEEEQYGEH